MVVRAEAADRDGLAVLDPGRRLLDGRHDFFSLLAHVEPLTLRSLGLLGFQDGDAVDRGILPEQQSALVLRYGDFRRLLELPRVGFAAHLPDQLRDLKKAGRADRMAA